MAQAVACFTAAVLAFVYRFPPAEYAFYPACPIAQWLHLECPGCGSTRALYALLHLRLDEAIAWNPLLPAVFLLAVAWGIAQYASATWRDRFLPMELPAASYWAAASAGTLFFVFRNAF